jgi:hypothetical protein
MATRSRIGILDESGQVRSIYCHFDGYPKGVGAVLEAYYTDKERVEALLALGDISSLGCKLSEEDACAVGDIACISPEVTVAYHRDRGEQLNPCKVDLSLDSFKRSDFGDYAYVFTAGEWLCFRAAE